MNALKFIKAKQKAWATINNITLTGSKADRGERCYTKEGMDNFFRAISDDTYREIKSGDGNELGNGVYPGKIQALHSSSALTVNAFDYWRNLDDKSGIAKALLIPSININDISFEKKYSILKDSNIPPNIDVVFKYRNGDCCAIECKFTEPFNKRGEEHGLKGKYLTGFDSWSQIPSIHQLAQSISPEDNIYKYLQPGQLIKHIMGLLKNYGNAKDRFRLIYLYYDAFGEEGYCNEREIKDFKLIAQKDGIRFQSITWQEVILNLLKNSEKTHRAYTRYLFSRYL